MTNDEYRAEQAERRQHGLKARHELRLENATYTAAEVKVMTKEATMFGVALGRKEAADEIESRCELDTVYDVAARHHFARIARDIGKGDPNG